MGLDAIHQIAAAVWVGGLAHLALHGARQPADTDGTQGASSDTVVLIRRFSTLALGSVSVLTVAGTAMTWVYVGILGVFAGWGRWLELRLPEAGRVPGWLSTGCFVAIGVLLLFYREG